MFLFEYSPASLYFHNQISFTNIYIVFIFIILVNLVCNGNLMKLKTEMNHFDFIMISA